MKCQQLTVESFYAYGCPTDDGKVINNDISV